MLAAEDRLFLLALEILFTASHSATKPKQQQNQKNMCIDVLKEKQDGQQGL